jgi:transposase-like protein
VNGTVTLTLDSGCCDINRRCTLSPIAVTCFQPRSSLSFRDVEDLLAQRGIDVPHETVRRWSVQFGLAYAKTLRKTHPRTDVRWHLDEVFVSINGKSMYLWRTVDC